MLLEGEMMPTNRELELDRIRKLDEMLSKINKILDLLEDKPKPRKKVARKTSKSS
jgi:hypothetical protein